MKGLFLLLFFGVAITSYGQRYSYKKKFGTQKNTMYLHWGYNRSIYTKSTINFVGSTFNFKLKKAAAKDRPTNDFASYFNPGKFTVPQFNVRIGWYYKFRWDWSFGWDHMKYVVRDYQSLYINGVIEGNTNLDGTYTDSDGLILIRPDDLHYENTNGLNYVSFQLNNTAPIYKTDNRKFAIQRRLGGGLGVVLTQTDFNWNGEEYHSDPQFGGYGISLHGGIRFDFFNHIYLQNSFATGFIHLPKNGLPSGSRDYASHKFMYASWEITLGVLWYLRTKNGCDTCPDWH
ncbi:MAG: hypothetical protein HUJ25_10420 [Crocinitomicaceae bacterium]|nr:hypothetical protein [Crocinitomicaceae bacterium]